MCDRTGQGSFILKKGLFSELAIVDELSGR